MKSIRRTLAALLSGLALAAVVPVAPAHAATCYNWTDAERKFARLTNHAREAGGVRRVHLDPELSRVAKKHSFEMADKKLLYHTPTTTLKRRVTRWEILGENVGRGSSIESLQDAFLNSPSHLGNIVYSKFRHLGVGVVKSNGSLWVTVVFDAYDNPGTRLTMPNC